MEKERISKISAGNRAHEFVKDYLIGCGWMELGAKLSGLRGLRLGLGEVDLVMMEPRKRRICLIEVKYLRRPSAGIPVISPRQVERLYRSRLFLQAKLTGIGTSIHIFLALVSGDTDLTVEFLENP